jgi:hypothetical protein
VPCFSDSASDCAGERAERVTKITRGKRCDTIGDRGVERRVDSTDPTVVNSVIRRVAHNGDRSTPAKQFRTTEPGIENECFHIAVMLSTARTCNIATGLLVA